MLARAVAPQGRYSQLAVLAAVVLTATLVFAMPGGRGIPLSDTAQAPSVAKVGRLPLAFVPNGEQFTAHGAGSGIEFSPSGVVFTLNTGPYAPMLKGAEAAKGLGAMQAAESRQGARSVVSLQFLGANASPEL